MKEIGNELKEARETMGVTLDEAATDLKLKPSQLENIEIGNRSAFKDVFELKQIIRDYAKYLSLEYEKLEDEFNEFVFEYTSKIPLEEIAKANEEKKLEKREIVSPYTIEHKKKSPVFWLIMIMILVIAGVATYFILDNFDNEEQVSSTSLTNYIIGE